MIGVENVEKVPRCPISIADWLHHSTTIHELCSPQVVCTGVILKERSIRSEALAVTGKDWLRRDPRKSLVRTFPGEPVAIWALVVVARATVIAMVVVVVFAVIMEEAVMGSYCRRLGN